jgi:hypothetical protein
MKKLTVIVPHTSLHSIRSALYRTYDNKYDFDIIVLYDKDLLEPEDYPALKREAYNKLSQLSQQHHDSKVALCLTGSYAACVIVYDILRKLNYDVILLQFDVHRKRYIELSTHDEQDI